MNKTITTDDILGKEAMDNRGTILGVIQQVHIDPKLKTITGITIDEGFMKPDLYVSADTIKKFGKDIILLNTAPHQTLKGKEVYSKDGTNLGKVSTIDTKANKLKTITVTKNFKQDTIQAKSIKTIGKNILLKQ